VRGAPASDDGAPDPRLTEALQRWKAAPGAAARAEVLAALSGARVFLALAARATGTEVSETTGLVQERSAEMALLSVVRPDGARALPAFTDGHAVQRWRPEARPVPVPGPLACSTARDDAAAALLLDPPTAGFVVDAGELAALAAGRVPVPGSAVSTRRTSASLTAPSGPLDERLVAGLVAALTGEAVRSARLLDGPDGPVLGIVPVGPASAADLAGLADRVARRLGPLLPAGGLDLAAVPPDGPGHPLPMPVTGRRGLLRRRRDVSARGR
jgi:hypothetical protein